MFVASVLSQLSGEDYVRCIRPLPNFWEDYVPCISPLPNFWEDYVRCISPLLNFWDDYVRCIRPLPNFWEDYVRCIRPLPTSGEDYVRCISPLPTFRGGLCSLNPVNFKAPFRGLGVTKADTMNWYCANCCILCTTLYK